jgi:hypothetical protein
MKRTFWYAAMTKDEAQHSRMTFYEAVNNLYDIYNTAIKIYSVLPFNSRFRVCRLHYA